MPVRHVPVDPESFAFYGEDLLPNFNDQPTWRYATPHNIQRNTPQTESCNNCHGNADIFLTADKVLPEELDANAGVIVDEIPEPRDEDVATRRRATRIVIEEIVTMQRYLRMLILLLLAMGLLAACGGDEEETPAPSRRQPRWSRRKRQSKNPLPKPWSRKWSSLK